MRHSYRIREVMGEKYPFTPQYTNDSIKWRGFPAMGGDESFIDIMEAIERIKKDINEQRVIDAKTIYHPYPLI